jgi:GNAT superfamily N-acetyltransferase
MLLADLHLARRLEAAEGHAAAQFALARKRLVAGCGSEVARIGGADVIFDGAGSPITQTFGLGMEEPATPAVLEQIEAFFVERGAATQQEVCPLVGVATLALLAGRGYQPIEISTVLYRALAEAEGGAGLEWGSGGTARGEDEGGVGGIRVRLIESEEAGLWSDVNARGWSDEHQEFEPFMREVGTLLTAREASACFLAEIDGSAAAAGALAIHEGVALLAGASTLPEQRRRGLQTALLGARLAYARELGCDVAMIVTEAGSNSQRNAQRAGFLVAYTRMKWKKDS